MNFNTMLDNVYEQLGTTNKKSKLEMPIPELEHDTTRIVWKNCKDFLKKSRTPPEHFLEFIEQQIDKNTKPTWFSNSIQDGLIIPVRIKPSMINKWIEKIGKLQQSYIQKYVMCNVCEEFTTNMTKNNDIRRYIIKCNCGAEYSI